MAEVERDSVKEAEDDVIMNPNLLQYYETEVEVESDENFNPMRIDLDIRKDFDLLLELNKIDKKDFKDIDRNTIECVYENRTTKGSVFAASAILSKYKFVFSFPFKMSDSKVVKVLSDVAELVITKLVSEDLAKSKPDPWEKSLA
jgi:hypothetical protein